MTASDYRYARDKAKTELTKLLNRRSHLDKQLSETNARISEVSKAVEALDLLVGDGDSFANDLKLQLAGLNLTDAVRLVLQNSDAHLTAFDIHQKLRKAEFPLDGYVNPGASIHTMLKRLEESGTADVIIKSGKTAYRLLPED